MRPSEKYLRLMRIARLCAAACGSDVIDPNYKVNFITACVVVSIIIYFIFTIYTIRLKFAENWGVLLESFCLVGSVLQGIAKLLSGITFTKIVSSTNKFLIDTYQEYEKKGENYAEALSKILKKISAILKFVSIGYIIVIIWFLAVPIVLHMITGKRYLTMQFYLPGLDIETTHGYFMTYAAQSTCIFFGAFGNFAGDLILVLLNTQGWLFIEMLKLKILELNNVAETQVKAYVTNRMVNDIIDWHQKYSIYTQNCNTSLFWMTFAQVSTSGLSIVLTLFILLTGDWIGSYCYLWLQFAMLYMYCSIGTLIEITNDDFCNEIYNISWYALPVSQQKSVLLMLMKSQNPDLITVGGVMPLSVSTALQVTKSIYSIMMMMLNFIK